MIDYVAEILGGYMTVRDYQKPQCIIGRPLAITALPETLFRNFMAGRSGVYPGRISKDLELLKIVFVVAACK